MKKYLLATVFLLPLSVQAANKMSSHQVVEAFYTDLISNTGNDANLAERAARVVSKNWESEPVPFGGPGLDGLVATLVAIIKSFPISNGHPRIFVGPGLTIMWFAVLLPVPRMPIF
jgi:hypothetical protein